MTRAFLLLDFAS